MYYLCIIYATLLPQALHPGFALYTRSIIGPFKDMGLTTAEGAGAACLFGWL
jgi:hypothetical protein